MMNSTDFDYIKGSEKPRDAGSVYQSKDSNSARPQLNVNVSAAYSYLSVLTREQGKLPDELASAQATLQRHIATLASDPQRAENANPVPQEKPLLELASKMLLRNAELQEQVADAFTTRMRLVKTSEAVDELKSYAGTLPRIFQESNEPGRALMRYLCEVIVRTAISLPRDRGFFPVLWMPPSNLSGKISLMSSAVWAGKGCRWYLPLTARSLWRISWNAP